MQILVGADPEMFLRDGDNFVSGYNVIKGTKANPFRVERGAVQVDGMAVEFNIEPAASEDEFCININTVLEQLRNMIPANLSIAISPVAHFSKDYMKQQPEEALALGCDPDFNAWTLNENPRPDQELAMRTAAGHVHVGWTNTADVFEPRHYGSCVNLTRQLDYYLGLPSLLLDTDQERRKMYGKAGCFRPKTYGMEYRVLSNFWIADDNLRRWVYRNTIRGVNDLINAMSNSEPTLFMKHGDAAQRYINTNDKKQAENICTQYNLI